MKLDDFWKDWEPSKKQVADYAKGSPPKPTKPGFEGFGGDHSSKTLINCNLEAELAACEEAAGRWLAEHCSLRDHLWWSVTALHRAYCAWCDLEGQEVRADLDAFRGVLLEKGFTIIKGDLVHRLVPTKDFLTLDKDLRVSYLQG
jgi:hypothetical protein